MFGFAAQVLLLEHEKRNYLPLVSGPRPCQESFVIGRPLWEMSAVVLFVCFLTIGCKQDSNSEPAKESAGSAAKAPLLGKATLKDFKASLGSDFTVDKEGKDGTPTVLLRESGALRTVIIVMHDAAGRIQSLSAHVVGGPEDDAAIDQAYLETAEALAKALDVPVNDEFASFIKVGVLRTRLGFPYNFTQESVYFRFDSQQAAGRVMEMDCFQARPSET